MKTDMRVLSYAVADSGGEVAWPEARVCALPAAAFHPRKARLPGLAWELCQAATAGVELPATTSVLFGTALGCLTETAAFVENMIEGEGVAPRPRAFTASVHNAIASEVARRLGARGENQTFVHGEVSPFQALFAAARQGQRGETNDVMVGALDEWSDYVARGRAVCGAGEPCGAREGGALLHLRPGDQGGVGLARITRITLARPRNAVAWSQERLAEVGADAVLATGTLAKLASGPTGHEFGDHPAVGACALAYACAWVAGEMPSEASDRPESVAVVCGSRFGDVALALVQSVQ